MNTQAEHHNVHNATKWDIPLFATVILASLGSILYIFFLKLKEYFKSVDLTKFLKCGQLYNYNFQLLV